MKTFFLLPGLLLLASAPAAQTIHYFEIGFKNLPPGVEWRDTSFVVAASDPVLLAEIAAELAKPVAERRHVSGSLAGGNGGHNRNGTFWFSWHFPVDQWSLADFSIEVCDGRPYTDVEQDTAYWIGNLGQFCPWSSYVRREISPSTKATEPGQVVRAFENAPNPAGFETEFIYELAASAQVRFTITDAQGRLSITSFPGAQPAGIHRKTVATGALSNGVYYAILEANGLRKTRRFIVQH